MKQAAVLGQPIAHSKSPVLHRAAYEFLNAPIEYRGIDLDPAQVEDFADGLRDGSWAGCSVTMPHKDAFVPLMDTISDRVRRLGALNTIVVGPEGLHGENTDIYGIVQAFADAGLSSAVQGAVLGGGNTALAAIEALAELGVTELRLVVRDAARAGRCLELAEYHGMNVDVGTPAALGDVPVVISTLPPRAADSWVADLGAGTGVLLDVAYDPWPSKLATAWDGKVISGLSMLAHQAVEQVRLFTGLQADAQTWEDVTNVMCDAIGLSRQG